MRFLTRTLMGVFLLCLTAGLLALAGGSLYRAMNSGDAGGGRGRGPQERVFTVLTGTIENGPATPVITAYGEVSSRRTLEVRAAVAGRVVEIADAFRDGGRVKAGTVLLRVDPADAESALALARAELAEAKASRAEAETRLELAEADLAAAKQARELRAQALARQEDLRDRGAGTGAAVEDAEIALASAEQALVGRRQALAQAKAALDLARIAVERRQIAVDEAERTLADTTVTAPFDGLLTEASVVDGAIVGTNEKIGSLIDPDALEVAFRVSTAQFARLLGPGGRLGEAEVTATLPLDDDPVEVSGIVDRAGAEVGAGQTGRLLYARLHGEGAAALRPGDFLTVTIVEPPLSDVAVIPASAASAAGEILLVGEDDRLEAAEVRILRRQGDMLIVDGAPEGRDYVVARAPHLGPGVKVRAVPRGDARAAVADDGRKGG